MMSDDPGTNTPIPATRCWFFHDWSQWKTIEQGELIRPYDDRVVGIYIAQKSECLRCGAVRLRRAET